MISSTTSNKLAEIIRDTWPNLYRPPAYFKPPSVHIPKKTQRPQSHLTKPLRVAIIQRP